MKKRRRAMPASDWERVKKDKADAAAKALIASPDLESGGKKAPAKAPARRFPGSRTKVPPVKDATGTEEITQPKLKQQDPTTIQSLILSKKQFDSVKAATKWVTEHKFKANFGDKGVDESDKSYRFRQRNPGDFKDGSLRTIDLTDGVQAVIGKLKETTTTAKVKKQKPEKLANARAILRQSLPDHPGERCGTCVHFSAPTGCSIVEGPVAEDLLCDWIQSRGATGAPKYTVSDEDWIAFGLGMIEKQPYQHIVRDVALTPAGPVVLIEDTAQPSHRFSLSKEFHIEHTSLEHHWTQAEVDELIEIGRADETLQKAAKPEDKTFLEHAEHWVKSRGLLGKDSDYGGMLGNAVLTMAKQFSDEHHSGGSAHYARAYFNWLVDAWDGLNTMMLSDESFEAAKEALANVTKAISAEVMEKMKKEKAEAKAEEDQEVKKKFWCPITKQDPTRRLVTGIVLTPETVDAQGDIISAEVIEQAAHRFLSAYNAHTRMQIQHNEFRHGIELVESYIAPSDFVLGSKKVKKGTWLITVFVGNDTIWDKVKTGRIRGFSIGGMAKVSPMRS